MKRIMPMLLVVMITISCNEKDGDQNPVTRMPAVTEIGIPIGDAVTKDIGTTGGTITSEDGIIDIIVPAGAVSTATTFSIQPITNFCPGGRWAYRLLPEGMTFNAPVTLVFHYTDEEMEGTSPEFLGIAFQNTDHVWYRLRSTVDTDAKTISSQVKHFTDWSILSYLDIAPRYPLIPDVRVKKTLALELVGADDLPPLPNNTPSTNPSADEDELPPLPQPIPFEATWFVNGVKNGNNTVGKITIDDKIHVTYHAPDNVPSSNPVVVSAELTGFKAWDHVNGKYKTFNKVILFKRIKIKGDEYNYKFRMEIHDGAICAYLGQTEFDAVEADIHVKGSVVTVSNFNNRLPIISPAVLPFTPPGSNWTCTVTAEPVGPGSLNFTSASGEVEENPFEGYENLSITLTGQSSSPRCTVECPGLPPVIAESTSYGFSLTEVFVLYDSIQTHGKPNEGIYSKITPTN